MQDALARHAQPGGGGSMIILSIIALMAILAPYLSPHAFDEIYWDFNRAAEFEHAHWFEPTPTAATCSCAPSTAPGSR